jgi:hypothetical protein
MRSPITAPPASTGPDRLDLVLACLAGIGLGLMLSGGAMLIVGGAR